MIVQLLFVILILAIIAFFSTGIGASIIDYFNFFVEGQKYNFSVPELHLLWKVGQAAELKRKSRLFWSVTALQEAIVFLTNKSKLASEALEKEKFNELLSKLYTFRTKVELESVQKMRGLETTRQLKIGQLCVLVFANFGQFYASLIENDSNGLKFRSTGKISLTFNPTYRGDITIYLWRDGDAGYIFRTTLTDINQANSGIVFSTAHSKEIIRTQKRKSIRAKSNFKALLFPQHPDTPINIMPEIINGVKCIIKDISEDGAQVLVKGKCVRGLRAKLQFDLGEEKVIMFVKAIRFTYSTSQHMSKIHFQCLKISDECRNNILSYVYEIGNYKTEYENKQSTSSSLV